MLARSRPRLVAGTLAALLLACFAEPGAEASTFAPLDLPKLTRLADGGVVRARVEGVRSEWNSAGTFIFTYVTLNVTEQLKGTSDDSVTVRVPGGTVGGFTAEMEGAPRFEPGDDVVVFLGRWDDGAPMVAGYAAGVSRVAGHADLMATAPDEAPLEGGVAAGLRLGDLKRRLIGTER